MAKFLGSRSAKQCKSHLQKVGKHFDDLERKLRSPGRDQTVYTSYLLYLAQVQVAPSPGETVVVINSRPPLLFEETLPTDQDFLPLGDLWTLASTSLGGPELN